MTSNSGIRCNCGGTAATALANPLEVVLKMTLRREVAGHLDVCNREQSGQPHIPAFKVPAKVPMLTVALTAKESK